MMREHWLLWASWRGSGDFGYGRTRNVEDPKENVETALDGGGLGSVVTGSLAVNQRRGVDKDAREVERSW